MKRIIHIYNKVLAILLNYISQAELFYIIEPADWAIKWDGHYILHLLKNRIRDKNTHQSIGYKECHHPLCIC